MNLMMTLAPTLAKTNKVLITLITNGVNPNANATRIASYLIGMRI